MTVPTHRPTPADSADGAAALAWLAGQKDAMLALLEALVNIDSGSYDKAGVDGGGARAVLGGEWPRLRPGRLGHEGRVGDECLRARGLREIRRCARPADRPRHQRRGNRLARLPAGDRGDRPGGPGRVQQRAWAAQ